MPPVPQHILNWLYSVLTSEYHDVNRTYNDVAVALAQYPSLAPRTDVHTFENGTSALLLHLAGTLPVLFRGTTYRFPISVRLPYAYPREPPLVYVTPTETMMVRPGQHVDPQGQVYHPYLAGWPTFWDKSSVLDFLAILRDVFAKEPPVIARPASESSSPAPPRPQHTETPPPLPPPPRELSATSSPSPVPQQHASPQQGPPRPPPKTTGYEQARGETPTRHDPSGPPPRPPPPPGLDRGGSQSSSTGPPPPARPHSQAPPSRYDSAPPLPHQQPPPQQYQPHQQSPPPPFQGGPPGPPAHVANFLQRQQPQQHPGPPPGWQPPQQQLQQQQQQHPPPPFHHQQQQLPHQQQPPPMAKSPPPPNLLDEPLTLDIPTSTLPAPPIPPNPEKDALLRQLAQTLHAYRQRAREQNDSSLAGLQAQRNAMSNASAALQSEMATLAQTSALLSSNAGILHDALRKADAAVEGSRRQTAPDIDELLVAPTVVANQLYALVAEERAMGDAIFVLGRAVERGRISAPVFAKTTRSLAREWYLKKALARKIARGMGLTA